jgi:hypothetical protein
MCSPRKVLGAGNCTRTREPLLGKTGAGRPVHRPPSQSGDSPFVDGRRLSPDSQSTQLYSHSRLIQANSPGRLTTPERSPSWRGAAPRGSYGVRTRLCCPSLRPPRLTLPGPGERRCSWRSMAAAAWGQPFILIVRSSTGKRDSNPPAGKQARAYARASPTRPSPTWLLSARWPTGQSSATSTSWWPPAC